MNEKKPVVLVIEDEKPLLGAIKTKLEKNNFEVVTAREVAGALNLLRDISKIDVIWLDHYLLGKENGLDFVIKVKGSKKWKKIPIFVVSNTASADKITAYIKLGVNKYYTKANYRLDNIITDIKEALSW